MIGLLPADAARPHPPPITAVGADPLAWAAHRYFMPSARSALEFVLRSLAPKADDEVLITNSSGQTYIPSCVTCTVFNVCQPTRVLTERTRAIVVIHEYGHPHPHIAELTAAARRDGIPLIEDCAHSIDSTLDGIPLGSWGDFALFSLPKFLPVRAGGILVSAQPISNVPTEVTRAGEQAAAAYREHLPAISTYSQRRRRNGDAIRGSFAHLPLLLAPAPGVTPFFIGLITPDAVQIRQRSAAVQWGSTLREDLLLVTTNPFVEPGDLVAAVESAFSRSEVA